MGISPLPLDVQFILPPNGVNLIYTSFSRCGDPHLEIIYFLHYLKVVIHKSLYMTLVGFMRLYITRINLKY